MRFVLGRQKLVDPRVCVRFLVSFYAFYEASGSAGGVLFRVSFSAFYEGSGEAVTKPL